MLLSGTITTQSTVQEELDVRWRPGPITPEEELYALGYALEKIILYEDVHRLTA